MIQYADSAIRKFGQYGDNERSCWRSALSGCSCLLLNREYIWCHTICLNTWLSQSKLNITKHGQNKSSMVQWLKQVSQVHEVYRPRSGGHGFEPWAGQTLVGSRLLLSRWISVWPGKTVNTQ